MKYKLINTPDESNSAIEQVFINRGIKKEDVPHYLNTTDADILDPLMLDNMHEGAVKLLNHINNDHDIFIIPDVDADGFTSAAILMNYIYAFNPDFARNHISYEINENKVHGIVLENIPDNVKMVICPDSASNDFEQHKYLADKGIDVLILDHHEADKVSEHAIVINNQLCNYPNKTLSGAGVVYKFCCYLDTILNLDNAKLFVDLVALGLVSDMVSLQDFETKHLVQLGMNNLRNLCFKELKAKSEFLIGNELTPDKISFYITPYINATVRMGSRSEKRTLFEAMLDFMALDEIPSTKRGCKGQMETRVEQACRNCTNIKKRQTNARDASLKRIEELIEENHLLDNKILVIQVPKEIEFEPTLNGLIANQLMSKYQKPTMLLRESITLDEQKQPQIDWVGSARGVKYSALENFRKFTESTNLVNYAQGHPNAYGASISDTQIQDFIKTTNQDLQDMEFDPCYKVDFVFQGKEFNPQDILKIAEYQKLYGEGVEEPYIVIENLIVQKNNLHLYKGSTLKIELDNGCSLVQFKSSEEEYEKLYSDLGCVKINVVGKCKENVYYGRTTAQVTISDYEIVEELPYYF